MGQSSSPKNVSTLNPAQDLTAGTIYNKYIKPGLMAGNSKGGAAKMAYKGERTAPLVGDYSRVQSLISGYDPSQFSGGMEGAINSALSGQPSYNLDPQTTQNWFKDAVEAPMMQTFNQQIAPSINSQYAARGAAFSTRKGQAIGTQLGNMQTQMAAQLATAQLHNQDLNAQLAESAKSRQMQGVGLASAYREQPLQQAGNLASALAPFQAQAQAKDSDAMALWSDKQQYNNPYLKLAMNYIGTPMTAQYTPQPSGLAGLIGTGAGMAAGAIAAPFTAGLSLLPAMAMGAGLGGAVGGTIGGTANPSSIATSAMGAMNMYSQMQQQNALMQMMNNQAMGAGNTAGIQTVSRSPFVSAPGIY